MKFSTVAASVALFGTVALAVPGKVVYQTEIQTITSCAPEIKDCPSRATATPVAPACPGGADCPAPPAYTHALPIPSKSPEQPPYPCTGDKCPTEPKPPVGTGVPSHPAAPKPPMGTGVPSVPKPPMGTGLPNKPTGTGSYTVPKNTSAPAIPSTPAYEGAASTNAFSVVALIAAAGALFLA